ncbi:rRNA maturation RNase YbeY [uncultured Aquimarina sp.]|uniref:rRNA maturation RNase YbeY n=1 Tax=uncultured Aquimarina sp. TaxID=575652 RepID=UPI002627A7A6|nr:rRNA maturation RNase YbeY [uncultured Aquimarina sp.]
MINFFYESVATNINELSTVSWLNKVAVSEKKSIGEISLILCLDDYLLDINQKYLNHDTYTDIISFDNTMGNKLAGDIFISVDRVKENAEIYEVDFEEELRRVMVHGLLHFCGYKDKTEEDKSVMRQKENEKLKMFHVEHL